jgi:DNA-binding MarR family transcriptional regulator
MYMTEDVVRQLGYLTLGTRLRRLGERLQADTQRILDEHGVTIPTAWFPFLAALDRIGPSTIGALAEAVGVSQPGATRALAQLADAGLVAVSPGADDQRQRFVALARPGQRLVSTAKREVWPLIEAAVRGLCAAGRGPLLDQLAAIEDGLAAAPLDRRAAALRAGGARERSGRRTRTPAARSAS